MATSKPTVVVRVSMVKPAGAGKEIRLAAVHKEPQAKNRTPIGDTPVGEARFTVQNPELTGVFEEGQEYDLVLIRRQE